MDYDISEKDQLRGRYVLGQAKRLGRMFYGSQLNRGRARRQAMKRSLKRDNLDSSDSQPPLAGLNVEKIVLTYPRIAAGWKHDTASFAMRRARYLFYESASGAKEQPGSVLYN